MKKIRINDFLSTLLNSIYATHILQYKQIYSLTFHDISYKIVINTLYNIAIYYNVKHYNVKKGIKNISFAHSYFAFLDTQKEFSDVEYYNLYVCDEAIVCFPKSIDKTVKYISKDVYRQILPHIEVYFPEKVEDFKEEYESDFEKMVDELYNNPIYQFVHDVLNYDDIKIEVPRIDFVLEEKIEDRNLKMCSLIYKGAGEEFIISIFCDKMYYLSISENSLHYEEVFYTTDNTIVYETKDIKTLSKSLGLIYAVYKAFIDRIRQYIKDLVDYAKKGDPLARKIIFSVEKALYD